MEAGCGTSTEAEAFDEYGFVIIPGNLENEGEGSSPLDDNHRLHVYRYVRSATCSHLGIYLIVKVVSRLFCTVF